MTEEDRAELLAEAVEQSCRLVKHMGELLEIVIRERDEYKDMLGLCRRRLGMGSNVKLSGLSPLGCRVSRAS